MTEFRYFSLKNAHLAEGAVVVIDVLRAFTTAAYAFSAGAVRIYPVARVDEAFALRMQFPDALIMGEDNGYKPEGFDFGNSPLEISAADLSGRRIIQRTTAGTQGIFQAMNADLHLAASFVVAKPTAEYLMNLEPDKVSFIVTGSSYVQNADEDLACGEYIEALVKKQDPDPENYISRVMSSTVGKTFMMEESDYLKREDIEMSIAVNRFPFCLPVHKEKHLFVMIPYPYEIR